MTRVYQIDLYVFQAPARTPLPPNLYSNMTVTEDDDLKLLRASASHLSDLGKLIPQLLRKRKNDGQFPLRVREMDMWRIMGLV